MFGNWGGNGLLVHCAMFDWKGPLQQDSEEGFEMMWVLDGGKGLNWGGNGGT